jgi:hypothetical protein
LSSRAGLACSWRPRWARGRCGRSRPRGDRAEPRGKNAYVTSEHEGALSQFAISPVTGKITPLSAATVTAPSHGSPGVAVTP